MVVFVKGKMKWGREINTIDSCFIGIFRFAYPVSCFPFDESHILQTFFLSITDLRLDIITTVNILGIDKSIFDLVCDIVHFTI